MKTVKRILALAGVIFLLALYAGTLILAILGNENTIGLLKLAIYSTVVVPVLLWAYSLVYKLLKDHSTREREKQNSEKKSAVSASGDSEETEEQE